MNIYTLHSHHYDYLPYQVAAIRKHIPHDNIYVVQGPYRRNPHDSTIKLSQAGADALGVKLYEIYDCHPSNSFFRLPDIFSQLMAIPGKKLIMHGDLFPLSDINYILKDKQIAGSGSIGCNKMSIRPIWLLCDQLDCTLHQIKSEDIMLWESWIKPPQYEIVEPCFENLKGYTNGSMLDFNVKYLQNIYGELDTPLIERAVDYLTQMRESGLFLEEIKRLGNCNCHAGELMKIWGNHLEKSRTQMWESTTTQPTPAIPTLGEQ